MADTNNIESILTESLDAAAATTRRGKSRHARALTESLYLFGEEHGYEEAVASLADALLLSAAQHMAEAEKAARRQGVDDGPEVGDHVAAASRVMGVYAQVYAAYAVASATGGRRV